MVTDMGTPSASEPERLNSGITMVGKRVVILASACIGHNVRIAESVGPVDFKSKRVKDGGSVERGTRRLSGRPA